MQILVSPVSQAPELLLRGFLRSLDALVSSYGGLVTFGNKFSVTGSTGILFST